jgi:hypothetical protein
MATDNFSKTATIKKELNSLADNLYLINETEMTKDVYRIIASIDFDKIEKTSKETKVEEKLVSSYKEIDEKSKMLSNLFK